LNFKNVLNFFWLIWTYETEVISHEKGLAMILKELQISLDESDAFQKIIGNNQLIGLLISTGQFRKVIKAQLDLLDLKIYL
jgi:hypothetical protein